MKKFIAAVIAFVILISCCITAAAGSAQYRSGSARVDMKLDLYQTAYVRVSVNTSRRINGILVDMSDCDSNIYVNRNSSRLLLSGGNYPNFVITPKAFSILFPEDGYDCSASGAIAEIAFISFNSSTKENGFVNFNVKELYSKTSSGAIELIDPSCVSFEFSMTQGSVEAVEPPHSDTDTSGDTKKTTDSDKSTDTKKTTDSDKSTDTKKTTDSDRSTDTKKTTDSDKSTDTKKTTDSDRSTDTKKTTDSDKSTNTKKTTDSDKSTDTKKTTDSDKSTDTKKTTDSDKSTDTKKTTDSDKSTDTKKTTDSDKSTDTKKTTDIDKSTDSDKSTDTSKPQSSTGMYGDIDGNKVIDSADALYILRFSVQLGELDKTQQKAADVDSDGTITSGDALDVLRYSLGFRSKTRTGKKM